MGVKGNDLFRLDVQDLFTNSDFGHVHLEKLNRRLSSKEKKVHKMLFELQETYSSRIESLSRNYESTM
jgi:hypothetical protein